MMDTECITYFYGRVHTTTQYRDTDFMYFENLSRQRYFSYGTISTAKTLKQTNYVIDAGV